MKIENFEIPLTTRVSDLKIGDVVELAFMAGSPFRTAVVRNVTHSEVLLFRPYVHMSDVAYSNGIICYHGHEEICITRNSTLKILLRERRDIR